MTVFRREADMSSLLPFIPVRVNTEKQVWIWDTLRQALDTDELVYFPQDYASNHRGQTKLEVVNNGRICAVPGWSGGLVESLLECTLGMWSPCSSSCRKVFHPS